MTRSYARWPLKVLNWLARFVIGVVVLIVTLYFVISLAVAYFKLTGRIVEGQRMYLDMYTPTWAGLLVFQAVCVVILAVGLFLRAKLSRRQSEPSVPDNALERTRGGAGNL